MVLPAVVIDTLLPQLKDTELRLLLVVLRQTWGRNKEADWLSHTQLKARTGRASEAVSGALDALVRRGLVTARDEAGALLSDPGERRRSRARVYLCLGPALRQFDSPPVGKPKTTVAEKKESCRFRKSDLPGSQAGWSADKQVHIEEQKRAIRERLASL